MMWTCSEAVYRRSTSLSPLRQPGAPVQPLRGHRCHVCCGMPADSADPPPSAIQPPLSLHRTQRRRDAPRRGRRRKDHHQAAPVRSCWRLLPLSPAGTKRGGGDWGRPGGLSAPTGPADSQARRMDLSMNAASSNPPLWASVRGKSEICFWTGCAARHRMPRLSASSSMVRAGESRRGACHISMACASSRSCGSSR